MTFFTSRAAFGVCLIFLGLGPAFAQDMGPITPLNHNLAARTYMTACASCHYRGADRADFGTRSPVGAGDPEELAQTILFGKAPDDGEGGMPAFGPGLTDADVARLVVWLRSTVKPDAPWPDVAGSVTRIRSSGQRED